MKALSVTLVLGILMSFVAAGCINISAPKEVNIGGDSKELPKSNSKAEWKEFGKSYADND